MTYRFCVRSDTQPQRIRMNQFGYGWDIDFTCCQCHEQKKKTPDKKNESDILRFFTVGSDNAHCEPNVLILVYIIWLFHNTTATRSLEVSMHSYSPDAENYRTGPLLRETRDTIGKYGFQTVFLELAPPMEESAPIDSQLEIRGF